ncbi:5-formyltetrahydrofolate cyclo-ligase [Phenylobacterium sp.]|uniref:5-formyltetrahydrofolate cyclo-ligase n=1 Tax=Phenylobacterium sp. TaxID=1871053 RepID=UPI000C918B64|nr:5-formyltetrahydrofolate cyclo-ligase [Phenylobacterium sp.]MAK82131.1 5-formyltetrahydrofolate cyclo-ligase [Phenylobacterium sp.]
MRQGQALGLIEDLSTERADHEGFATISLGASDSAKSLAVNPVSHQKTLLRRTMRGVRRTLAAADGQAAVRAADHAPLARLGAGPVAGYIAQGAELDPAPLMAVLAEAGVNLALPTALSRDAPLIFRAWTPGAALSPDAFGIPAPLADQPQVAPMALIVPLLAFDRRGGRLGQGAGVYDRAIAALGAEHRPFLLGYAYAGQEIEDLPVEPHDQRLDAILTEAGLIEVR